MRDIELRFNSASLFDNESGDMTITGYINKTGHYSHILYSQKKKFREQIEPGVFRRALEQADDINLLYEHNPKAILSSTRGGHMTLEEDEIGLKVTAKFIKTSLAKDVFELIRAKVVNGCSFGFKVLDETWKKTVDGTYLRTIKDLQLLECTICEHGAYPQGMISARGLSVIEDVLIPDDSEIEVEETRSESVYIQKDVVEEKADDKTEDLLSVISKLIQQNNELISTLKDSKENTVVKQPTEESVAINNDMSDNIPNVKEEDSSEEITTTEKVSPVETESDTKVDLSDYKNILDSLKESDNEN